MAFLLGHEGVGERGAATLGGLAVDDAYAAAGAYTGTEEQVETFKLALQLDAVKVLGVEGIGHLDAAAHLCLGRCPEGQFLRQDHAGTQPEAQGE